MQYVTLFKFLEILIDCPNGGATLVFETDLPGNALNVRSSTLIPPTFAGRHPFRVTLPGITKGKLFRVTVDIASGYTARIYACKVYARILGPAQTAWSWYPVYVLETPVEWTPMKLPIEPTSDSWTAMKLPIEPTNEEWQAMKLPIEPTSEAWTELKLPITPTPVIPDWVQVPTDK
jgi:hypothetical protein